MDPMSQTLRRKDAEKRIPILRREVDTELTNLHRALLRKDEKCIYRCKEKLKVLRKEMIRLEM